MKFCDQQYKTFYNCNLHWSVVSYSACHRHLHPCLIVGDLQLVVRSKCHYEKADVRMRVAEMRSLCTSFISLINYIFPLHVYALTVRFIADATFLLSQCSASHTHTLSFSLSIRYPALFPCLSVEY
jgi:hypothetical protein